MERIIQYFPELTQKQKDQYALLSSLYENWNAKINVISRKDIDQLYLRHVLHSLAIAKVIRFKAFTEVMDVGTGGGFPGIPLAIMFPNCRFILVDSIGKKIKVVNEVVNELGLTNVETHHERAERLDISVDFIVSRAVSSMNDFMRLISYKFHSKSFNDLKNGVLYLKGGHMKEELKGLRFKYKIFDIPSFFEEEYFESKKVIHVYR